MRIAFFLLFNVKFEALINTFSLHMGHEKVVVSRNDIAFSLSAIMQIGVKSTTIVYFEHATFFRKKKTYAKLRQTYDTKGKHL